MNIAEELLNRAMERGPEGAESYFVEGESTSIEIKDGKVDAMKAAEEKGMSLRVLKNNAMGFSFSSDPSEKAVSSIIDSAFFSADSVTADEHNLLPEGPFTYPDVASHDETFSSITVEEKIDMAMRMERAAVDYDKRIRTVRQSAYADSSECRFIMNSKGVRASATNTSFCLSIMSVAEENGSSEVGYYFSMGSKINSIMTPEQVGVEAARMAVSMLGARSAETGKTTIVLDPIVGCQLLDAFSPVFSADSVQKGKSLLKGKDGKKIASSVLNIVDDGCLANAMNTACSDGEGVPSQKTTLVSEGVLTSFLHNCYTARKGGVESTGNGMRGGFKAPPSVSPSNLMIVPGKCSEEEMMAGVDSGLYVLEGMGIHTIDPVSGEFSIGISGFWIENGKKTFPVRGAVISGNVLDLFMKVDAVGDECRFMDNIASPLIRIRDIDLCG